MSEPSREKSRTRKTAAEPRKQPDSELYKRVLAAKPRFESKESALSSSTAELAALAASHGKSVDDLLDEAHTTADSQEFHTRALSLERQIAILRR